MHASSFVTFFVVVVFLIPKFRIIWRFIEILLLSLIVELTLDRLAILLLHGLLVKFFFHSWISRTIFALDAFLSGGNTGLHQARFFSRPFLSSHLLLGRLLDLSHFKLFLKLAFAQGRSTLLLELLFLLITVVIFKEVIHDGQARSFFRRRFILVVSYLQIVLI